MWTLEILVIVFVAFLFAGLVKGVVGLGLPTVSLAVLALALGLIEAMAIMLVPAFVTNVWQGLAGGAVMVVLRRIWPLLLTAVLGIWWGAGILVQSDAQVLSGFLGVVIFAYSAFNLLTPRIPPPGRWERWLTPGVGAAAGVITGLTGSFVPGVLYLQALGMPRDVFVQAMGVAFTVSTFALAFALARHELLSTDLIGISAVALAPAAAGMIVGQRVRRRLSEKRFRQVFFAVLLLLGFYLAARAFL